MNDDRQERADLRGFVDNWNSIATNLGLLGKFIAIKAMKVMDSDPDQGELMQRTKESGAIILKATEETRNDIVRYLGPAPFPTVPS